MDNNLRLAREHCRELLGENVVLTTNNEFLFKLVELQRLVSVLEGNDYGIIPFDENLPGEIMLDALRKLEKRHAELMELAVKRSTEKNVAKA